MIIDVFYYKSDMHVRPMRFSILCTPTDSSDNTRLLCFAILLCLFLSKYDISASRLTAVPCPETNLSILVCKSALRTKQNAISVAFKTRPETRWGICSLFTKLLFCINSVTTLVSHQADPPTLQQNCAHAVSTIATRQYCASGSEKDAGRLYVSG